jgi:hypothetical protein
MRSGRANTSVGDPLLPPRVPEAVGMTKVEEGEPNRVAEIRGEGGYSGMSRRAPV